MYAGVPTAGTVSDRPGLDHARCDRPGDSEVRDYRLTVLEQDVLRLDVAVHHALAVGIVERAGHLLHDPASGRKRERPLTREPLAEGLALHQRHDIVEQAVYGARVMERQDVRVMQRGGRLDLAEEPLAAHGGGDVVVQDLHRYLPVVLVVPRQVDRGHAAPAQRLEDLVRPEPGAGRQFLPRDPGQERRRIRGGGAVEKSILRAGYAVEQALDRPAQLGVGGAGAVKPRGPRRRLERSARSTTRRSPATPGRFRSRRRRARSPATQGSPVQLLVQPAARLDPVALHRALGDPERLRRLPLREPAEVPVHDYLAQPPVQVGESVQRLVECK